MEREHNLKNLDKSALRIITGLVTTLILIFVLWITMGMDANAAEWYEDYEYTIDNTAKTITITKYIGSAVEITIPGTTIISGTSYQTIMENNIFYNKTNIQTITIKPGCKAGKICAGMFTNCSGLVVLDVTGLDTSDTEYMNGMFLFCSNLTDIDVRGFDTTNVKYMHGMFSGCSKLQEVDVSGFNTSKIIDMQGMFDDCSSLINIDITGFNTSNVTDMHGMFSGCSNLSYIDVSNLNTSNVTDMSTMFYGCSNLLKLDISYFDMKNVNKADLMFEHDSNLELFLPKTWKYYNDAFLGVNSSADIHTIHYPLTMAEWKTLGYNLDSSIKIICSDGTIGGRTIEKITLDKTDVTMTVGETLQLTAMVQYSDGNSDLLSANRLIEWEWVYQDTDIIKVDGPGRIIATGVGDTVIRVRVDGVISQSAVCTVHIVSNESSDDDTPPLPGSEITADGLVYTVLSGEKLEVKAVVSKNTLVPIPDYVTLSGTNYNVVSIGDGAFKKTKAKAVSIGDGIETIGDKAFYNCKKLRSVEIGGHVISIGDRAFANCKKLTTINITTEDLNRIGNKAFNNIGKSAVISIPGNMSRQYLSLLRSSGIDKSVSIQ